MTDESQNPQSPETSPDELPVALPPQLSPDDLAALSSQLSGDGGVSGGETAGWDHGATDHAAAPDGALEPMAADAGAAMRNTLEQAELDALSAQLGGAREPAATRPPPAPADDPIAQAMAAAIAAEAAAAAATPADRGEPVVVGATTVRVSPEDARAFEAPELGAVEPAAEAPIEMLDDVQLDVQIELGRASMYIDDVLKLGVGSVVELDKLAGDPVDIYVNGKLIAHGEVLVLNDNFCVRINDIQCPVPELGQG